jgi:hypothetical protein
MKLRERGVLRSTNDPVADYTEQLVAHGPGLKLAHNSTAGFDATDEATGERYEIKGRRISRRNRSTMNPPVSAIRDLDKHQVEFLAGVLFEEDLSLLRAVKIPFATIKEISAYVARTNSHRLRLSRPLCERSDFEDITE